MNTSLQGAVVLVTGASSGLGQAIAIASARAAAKAVILNYANNQSGAEETAEAVLEAGAEAILAQGDVAIDSNCINIIDNAKSFGCIDALFNNAGVTAFASDHSNLDQLSADDFLNIYRVNVVGSYQMIRAARPLLECARLPGAVVNISSIAGVNGTGSSVAYAASKGALNTMTQSLARALAPRIRCNAICPGFIDTKWFEKGHSREYADTIREGSKRTTPLQAAPTPEEVANSALFLASPASLHVTGETLLVDAGLHLGRS